jgi:hypothetical protein
VAPNRLPNPNNSPLVVLVVYLVLVAIGPVLKLTHVLHCGWWAATVLLWGPGLVSLLVVVLAIVRARR